MRENDYSFFIINYNINSRFLSRDNNENFVILINVDFYNIIFKVKNNVFKFYNINFDKCFNS